MQTGEGFEGDLTPFTRLPKALYGTGNAQFAEDSYSTVSITLFDGGSLSDHRLKESNLEGGDLWRAVDGRTQPCFRSEAGSAGRDTKGLNPSAPVLIRSSWFFDCDAGQSDRTKHKNMLAPCAEAVLQEIGIAFRVIGTLRGDHGSERHNLCN